MSVPAHLEERRRALMEPETEKEWALLRALTWEEFQEKVQAIRREIRARLRDES